MTSWTRTCSVAGLLLLLPFTVSIAQEAMPIENVRLPIERWPNGKVRRQLHAREARMPANGPVMATGVRIECFDQAGTMELVVEADDCIYDQKSGAASSEGKVKAVSAEMTITGKGFTWTREDERVKILSEARVEFTRKGDAVWKRKAR